MKKIFSFLILISSLLIILTGCTPTLPVAVDENIDYSQEIEVTGNEYSKLSYLLE
jgi:hypothetical protein